MALHTFFFTAPEALARPPVGLEFKDLPHADPFDEAAAAAHEAACLAAMDAVWEGCEARHRERVTLDRHVGCVFERCAQGGAGRVAGGRLCPCAAQPASDRNGDC